MAPDNPQRGASCVPVSTLEETVEPLDKGSSADYTQQVRAADMAMEDLRAEMDRLQRRFGAHYKIECYDTPQGHTLRAIITIKVLR